MYKHIGTSLALLLLFSSISSAQQVIDERQAGFAECRAILQAFAGAVSNERAEYSINTDEVLESSFNSKDGTKRYTVTCLANEEKMIVKEENR